MFFKYFIPMLMLLSCGRAKDSEDQTRPNIKPPEYPTTAKLNLGSTIASTQSYNGALLIWHNAVTAKQILPIGEGTRKSRLAKAKLLKFERDVHDPYVLELATKIKTLTTEIQTITEAQLEANRGALKQNFAGWFENSINVLETEKKIDAAGKLQAQKLFGMFCEAQIIAFAADPTLSLISYKERPTPNQMCENYYTKKAFLQGPECLPDSSAAGKIFFTCLWQQGVAKTFYFDRLSKSTIGAESRLEILKAWTATSDDFLAKLLLNAKDKTGFVVDRILLSKSLDNDFMALAAATGDGFKKFQDPKFAEMFAYDVPNIFNDKWLDIGVPKDAILASYSSRGRKVKTVDLNFFGANKDLLELHAGLAKSISSFRISSATALSANDYIFNEHRVIALTPDQKEGQARALENLNKTANFKTFFAAGEFPGLKLKKSELAFLKTEANAPKTSTERGVLNDAFLKTQFDTRDAVAAANAAKAFFLGSVFEFKSDGKILDIKYRFTPKAPAIIARWDLIQKMDLGCLASIPAGQLCAEVTVDLDKSFVQLKRLVREPELEGFEFQSSVNMDIAQKKQGFNDIPPRDLRNRNFMIEAYQNRIDDVMDYFSVTTKFCELQNPDKCVWEGAMTLLP